MVRIEMCTKSLAQLETSVPPYQRILGDVEKPNVQELERYISHVVWGQH